MKKMLGAAVLALAMLAAQAVIAQDKGGATIDMQTLRHAVQTDKHALVASTLQLTDAQAKKFWPIYDRYQRSVDTVAQARALSAEALLGRDRPISDPAAKDLAARNMRADEAEMRARRKMYKAVMRVLPAAKAARYLQLEQKIRAMQAYDIAQAFPLVR